PAMSSLPFVIPPDVIEPGLVKIDGDSATVAILAAKGGRPIQFNRVNQEWKMAADGFWHLKPAVMNDILGRLIQSLHATTAQISQAKFKTPQEAVDAMKQKAS